MDLSHNQGNLKIVVTNGHRTVTTAFGICAPHNAIVQMSRQAKMTLLDHGYIGEIFPVSPDSTGDQGRQGQCQGEGVGLVNVLPLHVPVVWSLTSADA